MADLFFDAEFRSYIHPLTPDERSGLEANLKAHGNLSPIIVWKETRLLLDGHNRYDICHQNSIALLPPIELSLPDRDAATVWIIDNQLGRRNLSPYVRGVLALKREGIIARQAKEKQIEHGHTAPGRTATLSQNSDEVFKDPNEGRTDTRIASLAHVSRDTIARVKVIEERATPEQKAQLGKGDKTINEVYVDIKRKGETERRNARREADKVAVVATKNAALDGQYACIVLDPPWDWGDEGDVDQLGRARPGYAAMPLDDIAALPIAALSLPDCHIYLWITNRSLPKGFGLLEKWGFRYITCLTWVKPSFGMGQYFRGSTEQVLFGVKGSLPLLAHNLPTHFLAPRGEQHSAKPSEFFCLVEKASPGPRLEMFARSEREGWSVWGNL